MHLTFRNVNSSFRGLIEGIHTGKIPVEVRPSRVGEVLQIEEPVILTYTHPRERVLFNSARDANPVFHLYEALHMLAGRNDIAPLDYYSGNYGKQVRDGNSDIANGAYGYRWRHSNQTSDIQGVQGMDDIDEIDQLKILINHLKANPFSRRAVLSMWNVEDDLLKVYTSRDVCCNLCVCFSIREEFYPTERPCVYRQGVVRKCLDMTVFNRSNDLIWGCLGANYVHFGILLEYMAAHLGVEVGIYNQISNNIHVYTERYKPEEWLNDGTPDHYVRIKPLPLVCDPATFDVEVPQFVETNKDGKANVHRRWREPFLDLVAQKMCHAFHAHKRRDYKASHGWIDEITSLDWQIACREWIAKRETNWRLKNETVSAGTE